MRRTKVRKADDVDDFYETLLRSGPFPGDDVYERQCNYVLAEIKRLEDSEDSSDNVKALRLLPELRTAVIIMQYHGWNPKLVPYHHLRHALENPITVYFDTMRKSIFRMWDDLKPQQRERIKGPLDAVRSFCINCQGGNVDMVRACSTVNCFLWSFRMHGNPFYGRLMEGTGEEEVIEDEAELADIDAQYEAEEAERFAKKG